MQLKPRGGADNLRAGLMAATCALLAPAVKSQAVTGSDGAATQVDSGVLYYQEDQGRIRSLDAIVKLNHDFGDERVLGVTASVDSLSGGSPNGAVAQHQAQTFTTPSARAGEDDEREREGDDDEAGKEYIVAAGEQPLDPSFRDLRVAADLSWSQPLGIGNRLALGGHVSVEHDFMSASANLLFSHDFNRKNTTLAFGVSGELDRIKPVGGIPVAGSDFSQLQKGGTDSKHVLGAQLGVTQVLTRSWLVQLNLSLDSAQGYLDDPYKIVSQVDAAGVATGYLFESRPDSRRRSSAYLGSKLALGRSVLDVAWRYGMDDWGIHSQTVEAQWRLPIGGATYLQPQLRWYRQQAADFYSLYLAPGTPAGFASADPRLAAFDARTAAVKLGVPLGHGAEFAVRIEGYEQDAKQHHSGLAGLAGLDLNPRLRALMLQLDYRFGF